MSIHRQRLVLAGLLLGVPITALAENTISVANLTASKFGKDPADQADIVGRDLHVPLANVLGHVGLWTGSMVIEALSQSPAIVQNTLQDFKTRSPYWGAVYAQNWHWLPTVDLPTTIRPPYAYLKFIAKEAAIQRAILVQSIGAKYTMSPYPDIAWIQECNGQRCVGPKQGKYRCDTFVKDAYLAAGVERLKFSPTDTPSMLWHSYPERRE